MLRKIALLSTLALGAALALCGCPHRVEQTSGEPGSATTEKVELTLYTWTEVPEFNANQELINKFMASHPNITVHLQNESGGSTQAMAKLQTMMASKTAPDVMSLHGAYYYPFAAKGVLMDLEPMAAQDQAFNLQDFYPGLVKQCRWQDKLMSLPRFTSVYAVFYNKLLFDAAGLKYPTAGDEWTWDKYLEAAKKLTTHGSGGSGQWGCFIDFWGSRLYPWIWSNDADLMDEGRSKCTIDSPAAVEAISFLADLRLKYKVCPASSATERNQGLDQFTQGNTGMYITGPWDIQTLKQHPTLKWDIAPTPKKKRFATLLGTENYAISNDTKHPKEAWELFKFLLSAETQDYMQNKLEKMPSRKSVAEGSYLAGAQDAGYNRKVFVDALQYAQQAPNIPEWSEVSHYVQDELDLVWAGKKTAEEGCKTATEKVNKALQEIRGRAAKK